MLKCNIILLVAFIVLYLFMFNLILYIMTTLITIVTALVILAAFSWLTLAAIVLIDLFQVNRSKIKNFLAECGKAAAYAIHR